MSIYFYDKEIAIIYQGKIIKEKTDSIEQGLIKNLTVFIEFFTKIMKKHKIKTKILGTSIQIVKDISMQESYLFFLDYIFTELGFTKIKFINIKDLFFDNSTYIAIFKDYILLYLDKPVILDMFYFKDIPQLLTDFKKYFNSKIVLFGSNEIIPKINNKDIPIYYIDDYQNYIINCLLKVKKYGA